MNRMDEILRGVAALMHSHIANPRPAGASRMSVPDCDAEGFYIVWSPTGATPPKARHATLSSAECEAARLARQKPGQQFFVLSALSVSEVPPTTRKLRTPSGF